MSGAAMSRWYNAVVRLPLDPTVLDQPARMNHHDSTRLPVRLRTRGVLAGVVLFGTVAGGCVDRNEQAMCPAYAEYLAVIDVVAAAEPTAATAGDVVDTIDVVVGELDQLRAVADERYRAQIDAVSVELDDVRRTLGSVQDDADYSTWAPLVDSTFEDLAVAQARLRRVIDPACQDRNDNNDAAGSVGEEI